MDQKRHAAELQLSSILIELAANPGEASLIRRKLENFADTTGFQDIQAQARNAIDRSINNDLGAFTAQAPQIIAALNNAARAMEETQELTAQVKTDLVFPWLAERVEGLLNLAKALKSSIETIKAKMDDSAQLNDVEASLENAITAVEETKTKTDSLLE